MPAEAILHRGERVVVSTSDTEAADLSVNSRSCGCFKAWVVFPEVMSVLDQGRG